MNIVSIHKYMPYSARAVNALCTITKKYGATYEIHDNETITVEVKANKLDKVLAVLNKV